MSGELLLPGSLPCETAEQSFRIFGGALGRWLDYMPDGEVGTRRYWIDGLAYRVFTSHPDIETIKWPARENGIEQWWPRGRHDEFGFRVRPGVSKVRFGDPGWRLGFSRDAVNSYALFKYMKKDGVIPKHVRFQVCMPLTYSGLAYFFSEEDTPKVVAGLTEAFRDEAAKMVEMIPNDDLAIQWDLALEQKDVEGLLEKGDAAAAQKIADRDCAPAAEVCSVLPPEVRLGYHMCFGTLSGWPSRQPPDMTGSVLLANAAVAASGRRVDFLHFPTLGSAEDKFFAPLKSLKGDGAKIYMGTVHHLHGSGGPRRQIETIKKVLPDFGISAPCGFGRTADRPGRLLSDDGTKPSNPIDIVINDHKEQVALLKEVMGR
jgi:hypothetical protein